MKKNDFKERLHTGEVLFGAFSTISHPAIVEIMALAGMDFVILDGEHSSLTPESAENLYRAAELRGIGCVTRIGENNQQHMQKFLDSGAGSVLIPLVNSREEAERVVDAVKYGPIGSRGLAASRASDWGLIPGGLPEYVKHANEETFIAVQVETFEAVENFDHILAVEHIDMIFFGPSDLSSSLGLPGQTTHPKVVTLIEDLGRRTKKADKLTGTIARDGQQVKHWRGLGFQFLCTGVNNLFANGIASYLKEAKS
ncbi:aldolase [Candidatus Acetothermia bacterium]|nr:aldolase [Candidatus Acetothermia bacterium]MBI3644112.1 aldolase [Candidatus Acetothermia bacterium]